MCCSQVTCGPVHSVLLPYMAAGDARQFRERFLSVLGAWRFISHLRLRGAAGVGVNLVFGENGPQLFLICNGLWGGAVQAVGLFIRRPSWPLGKPNLNLFVALISSALWASGLFFLPQLAYFADGVVGGRSAVGLAMRLMFTTPLDGHTRGRLLAGGAVACVHHDAGGSAGLAV